jgi:site-specific DNA recombinase
LAVALYARVSTTRQAEQDLSIPDQLQQMRSWCKSRGHLIAKEYVEPGASATDDRRPVLQQLMTDARLSPAPFEIILVHSLSRFFRDVISFGVYERQLAKRGVRVISITQETTEDASGQLARRVFRRSTSTKARRTPSTPPAPCGRTRAVDSLTARGHRLVIGWSKLR